MESASLSGPLAVLVDWLAAHPTWAGLAVFVISLGESLVVVGLFIPGTAVMFAMGSLVALGAMGLWDTLLWSIAGAIVGDGLSFWIGHHYREHLRVMWPFRRHPEWFVSAEQFFARHGGKSVLFGRFAGPVRPIIPAVAGMMGMPPARFYLVNVVSALLWAPAYILPGVVLGASLSLAAGVATRLALLALLVLCILWFTAWLVRRAYAFLQPRAQRMLAALLRWGGRYRWSRELTQGIIDPDHPEIRAVLELGTLLLLATWLFFSTLAWQWYASGPLALDNRVYYLAQSFRTPWADQAMVLVAELSGLAASLLVIALISAWLLWKRHWPALGHWLAVLAFGGAAIVLMQSLLPVYPPALVLQDNQALPPAPSISLSTLIYGFLAILIARDLPAHRRSLPYMLTGVWLMAIMLSGLYLAQNWFSDILHGLTLALIWVALLGLAYRRHPAPPIGQRGLHGAILAGLLGAGLWHVAYDHATNLERYAFRRPQYLLAESAWWEGAWRQLPAYRIDWGGDARQPMTVQWAGELAALRHALDSRGWRALGPPSAASVLRWLDPKAALADLPVLPKVHDGQHEALCLVYRPAPAQDGPPRQYVLRLWPADTRLEGGGAPLWVGNVTLETLGHSLGMLTLPSVQTDFSGPLRHLQDTLRHLPRREVARPAAEAGTGWDGKVLLLRQANTGDSA